MYSEHTDQSLSTYCVQPQSSALRTHAGGHPHTLICGGRTDRHHSRCLTDTFQQRAGLQVEKPLAGRTSGPVSRWRGQSVGGREASAACPGDGRLQTAAGSVRWNLCSVHRLRSGRLSHEHRGGSAHHSTCRSCPGCSHLSWPTWATETAVMPISGHELKGRPGALHLGLRGEVARPAAPAPCPLVPAPPLRGLSPSPSLHVRGPACFPRPGGSEVPPGDPRVGPVGPGVWPPLRWSRDLTGPHDLQHLLPVRCPWPLPWCGFHDRLVPLCRWLL